ncbi:DUF481 domain-containing protein [Paraflavitalea soli]|uniref:DUF481 domain-containing protein n=1 Tax=Paraflavitalea soli TaxID=2315862 RepID=A0A3B7MQF4_9BACT|nr:DUF481 domain-containing protein [Paraflavitalea soli]AXY75270.1 DUF481 domain-containing protein [Paraflavitalea soli]
MKRMIIVALVLLVCGYADAQFNDSTHYHLKYTTAGIINRTNDARSFVLNNVLGFQVNKEKLTINSSNAWVYGRQGSRLTNNDFSTALNIDYLKNRQRLYYWGLVTFTTSYSLKINHQLQGGAGIGYNFFNKEQAELVVSDGLLYETSDLTLPQGVDDRYQTVRNSLRIKYRWAINNLVLLEGVHFWQPSLARFDDYIIRSNSALSIKLRKWLSLTTSLTFNKLSRTNRENLLVNFGLSAEKYF